LEGLLEMTTKSLGLVYIRRAGGREFHILGAATLKPRAPNAVRTKGTESRLLFVFGLFAAG